MKENFKKETILTEEEIEKENIRMRLEDNTLVLLKNISKMISRKKVLDFLREDKKLTLFVSREILDNRNIKNIRESILVESAIAIKRTSLTYLPTEEPFYRSSLVDENIATGIPFATPLLIYHKSLDEKWYYVQSSFYRGWIKKEDVLIISEQQRLLFEDSKQFITITKPLVPFLNTFLDLGVSLPVLGIHDTFYEVFIPTHKGIVIQNISQDIAYLGYVPYTRINILEIVKNYLNVPYTWGAVRNGVDCSFLIQSLFQVFGFKVPRDSSHQEKVMGIKKIDLKGKTEIEKKEILKTISYPAILHQKGHVLLAIAFDRVIHAYGEAKKVVLTSIENCYGNNFYPLLTSVSCLIN